jgi:hypothetical protein
MRKSGDDGERCEHGEQQKRGDASSNHRPHYSESPASAHPS